MTGASSSVSFVSWMSRMSGSARVSQVSTASWRALSELTFQVAIRMSQGYPLTGRPRTYDAPVPDLTRDTAPDPTTLVELIRTSVIGDDEAVAGPFGIRRVTYADYTASGRALSFIEDYLRDAVLPLYANTHTESSGTGLQTSRFREEARGIIRDAVGGTADHAVIFCGSGMTGAINKLVDVLNIRIPADLDDRYSLRSHVPAARATAGLHRSVRASQQRTAVA